MLTHLTISVSHHEGCRLVHPAMWSFKNVIRHHDGWQLVYPAMRDIEQFRFAFMMDVDWCIPPYLLFDISIQLKMSRIEQFVYNSINHSHAINCQTFQISHFQIHMHFRNIISRIYSFQVYLVITKHLKYECNFGEQRTNNT